ncbi:hypothetical protein [Falsarthrobacter nasiphocae]|uniref:Uncharacterized protein n=1 Tax=Falsarthrobacter nasiphocae TaxID=189863 RepID=A0AAE4C5R9_9MICC|nr:hypothetical protein [Falsarthrobacter nasiphocae]MDR6891758.1 hypothetical protein [Falsarthrobacter nasiphocae]
MDDLFSHPLDTQPEHRSPAPTAIESLGAWSIPLSLVEAVSGFVEHLHLWWPAELKADEDSGVELSGSDVVEVLRTGESVRLARIAQTYDAPTEALMLSMVFEDPAQASPLTLGWVLTADPEGSGSRLTAGARGDSGHPADGEPIEREDLEELVEAYARFVNASPV